MTTHEDVNGELVAAAKKGVEVVQQDENTVVVQAEAGKVVFFKEFGRFKAAVVAGVSTTFEKAVAAVRAEVARVEQAAKDTEAAVFKKKPAAVTKKDETSNGESMVSEGSPVTPPKGA